MGVLAIGLQDSGITAARSPGEQLLPIDGELHASPGVARVQRGSLTLGAAAAAEAYLHPRQIDDRFWDQLGTERTTADPRSPNRAEVACAHLRRLLEQVRPAADEDAVIAVPPLYDSRQLGIVVAVARELELSLSALVASPVALVPEPPTGSRLIVVELGLHRATVSLVECGDFVRLRRAQPCPGAGLDAFRRQWIGALRDELVRHTRFDPLHDAATEQRVHDELSAVLAALADTGRHQLSVQTGSGRQTVAVTDQLLAHSGHGLMVRLWGEIQSLTGSGPSSAILLEHRAATVPGLRRMLEQQSGAPVHELPEGAAALGLARTWPEQFEPPGGAGVAHYLRRRGPGGPPVASGGDATSARPTHLLLGDRAHPLEGDPVFIGRDAEAGALAIGPGPGLARLRGEGGAVVLEVAEDAAVHLNGVDARGRLPVGPGAEISVPGCAGTAKLITLAS
ncbi:MAG: hypothetical protein ACYTJ0_13615 [Planctomycetota bacterium]|jgi:hypothetical protein